MINYCQISTPLFFCDTIVYVIVLGHTYRSDKYQDGDDSVLIRVTMQMADAAASVQNSLHPLTLGAKLGLPVIFRAVQIMCLRSLTEVPDLVLEPFWNSTVNTTEGSAYLASLNATIIQDLLTYLLAYLLTCMFTTFNYVNLHK